MSENSKQPIYPSIVGVSHTDKENLGLTKREYFAGLAMQGILATGKMNLNEQKECINFSIKMADELLKQLEQK